MVPGMVGAVNYGSGRRAYDPGQTIAGKTGTCIEQGTWVGLFTSYAPLANPRLAVVVIARGADAHSHFPAAVAGKIYRDLSGRFGTPFNPQVATARKAYTSARNSETALDDEEEKEATALTRDWNDANNIGGINRARGAQSSVRTGTVTNRITADARPLARKAGAEIDSKVRPVLMQIPRRNQNVVKPAGGPNGTPSYSSERETRPRRVSVNDKL